MADSGVRVVEVGGLLTAHLLRSWFRIPLMARMFVSFVRCVLWVTDS